ncbi:MAG: putative acetyltransferase [Thermoleophilia bacterium]|nr:putative acetyltransferase [Thermoleophilia bacterium]
MIRAARIDEIELLQRIERDADGAYAAVGRHDLADGGDAIPSDVAARAIQRGRLWVAEDPGTRAPVGWLFETRSDGEWCIGQVSVAPSHGRRGIGTALLLDSIARAWEEGFTSIVLNTERDVPWNRPWYERHGFRVVAEADWSDDMRVIVAEQDAPGLDWSARVHMRLPRPAGVD